MVLAIVRAGREGVLGGEPVPNAHDRHRGGAGQVPQLGVLLVGAPQHPSPAVVVEVHAIYLIRDAHPDGDRAVAPWHLLVAAVREVDGGGPLPRAPEPFSPYDGRLLGVRRGGVGELLAQLHVEGACLAYDIVGRVRVGGPRDRHHPLRQGEGVAVGAAAAPDSAGSWLSSTGLLVAGSTSNAPGSSSSRPISRTAGMISEPMSRRLRMASSWSMSPSPSQKQIMPGRRYSRTCRIFGSTVFGVPVTIAYLLQLMLVGARRSRLLGVHLVERLASCGRGIVAPGRGDRRTAAVGKTLVRDVMPGSIWT